MVLKTEQVGLIGSTENQPLIWSDYD